MELSISVSHVEWIVDGVRMSLKARLNQFATHTSRIVSLSYHCSMCDILRANCLAKMGPALVFFEHDKNFLYEILDATLDMGGLVEEQAIRKGKSADLRGQTAPESLIQREHQLQSTLTVSSSKQEGALITSTEYSMRYAGAVGISLATFVPLRTFSPGRARNCPVISGKEFRRFGRGAHNMVTRAGRPFPSHRIGLSSFGTLHSGNRMWSAH
eukprot:scaffold207699_cov36-Tisochrysis_lutea.AAC.1